MRWSVTSKATPGIYWIRNSANGKVYIGSSVDIRRRWQEHKSMLNNGCHHSRHLQGGWNKYGPAAFRFEVIEEIPDGNPEAIMAIEQWYLDNTRCLDSRFGYNLAIRADRTAVSDETRQRLSEAHKKAWTTRDKNQIAELGKKCKGKSRPELQGHLSPYAKPIIQLTNDGQVIREWKCINDAANAMNVGATAITSALCGRNKTSAGFVWKYGRAA